MKYQSEIIKEIVDTRGHEKSSLHYESECIETWIEENKGAYPKLTDYQAEWLNYINVNPIGEFPYLALTDVTNATVDNVVPLAYKSAILKGNTGYRDIDTGEILETFEEGRNLELVSVKMPVLTTTGKNLFDGKLEYGLLNKDTGLPMNSNEFVRSQNFIPINCKTFTFTVINGECGLSFCYYDKDKNFISRKVVGKVSDDLSIPDGTAYLKFRTYPKSGESITNNLNTQIQIEEGTVATEYEPYHSNILTVNEEVELRGIGNVKDELNLLTGEYIQRVDEVVWDGSDDELWVYNEKYDLFACQSLIRPNDNYLATNIVGKATWGGANRFALSPSKYGFSSLEEGKEYLKNNPITIQYQLATESIKTVDLSVTDESGNEIKHFIPIEGTMHIQTNGTPIKPTVSMEIPVEAITQNLVSFIGEE